MPLLLLPNHCPSFSGHEPDRQSAPVRMDVSPFESPVVHRIMPPFEADSFSSPCDVIWLYLLNAAGSTPFIVQVLNIHQAPLLFLEYSRNSHLCEFVFFPLAGNTLLLKFYLSRFLFLLLFSCYSPILLLSFHTDFCHGFTLK